jgi:Holliday junction resolvase
LGKFSRDKGGRIEREIVNLLKGEGIHAERVPLSGAAGGQFVGDIKFLDYVAEVKARKGGTGFKTIERWLGDNDMLFLRRDRAAPLVVMPWSQLIPLLQQSLEAVSDSQ